MTQMHEERPLAADALAEGEPSSHDPMHEGDYTPAPEQGVQANETLPALPPTADTDTAIDFLRRWGFAALSAIDPASGRIETKTFPRENDGAGDLPERALRDWIDARQGKANLYFSTNRPARPIFKKAEKSDIARAVAFHCDADPRAGEDLGQERHRIRSRIEAFSPKPSVVVDSGGGFQCFWLLREPVKLHGEDGIAFDEIERRNRALDVALDGDSCFNVDRVMRLPGSINVPNKKKRDKGRDQAGTAVVWADWDRRYDLTDFELAPPLAAAEKQTAALAGPIDLDDLDLSHLSEAERDRCRAIVLNGFDPGDSTKYHVNGELNRSAATMGAAYLLKMAGVTESAAVSILTDARYAISAHCLAQKGNAKRAAERAYRRAKVDEGSPVPPYATDHNGRPFAIRPNLALAFDRLGVKLTYNAFLCRAVKDGKHALDNDSLLDLMYEVRENCFWQIAKDAFMDLAVALAREESFHPVRDYLAGLKWDGTPRIDNWLVRYCGATDSAYVRAIGRIFFVAAVRRVRKPGCKFDELLVLESPQGMGKSTVLRILAVNDDWFSDSLPLSADDKKVIEQTEGKWIIECGELRGMKQQDVEHLKAFCSRQYDRGRLSYDKLTSERPRQCVFAGTTNSEKYLRDTTGNRRFWPVKVGAIDLEAIKRDRDQLWAEAAAAEAAGEKISLDPGLYDEAAREQRNREVEEPWDDRLTEVLGDLIGKIRVSDVWRILDKPTGQQTKEDKARLNEAMKKLGFEKVPHLRFGGGAGVPAFARGDDQQRRHEIILTLDERGRVLKAANAPEAGDPGLPI